MKKRVVLGLTVAILFQLLVLVGVYVNGALPLWVGREIRVETVPVDPRSLFRGNYARLSYGFSRISGTPFDRQLRNGEVIYVRLVPGEDGLYEYSGLSLQMPSSGVFLRGRVAYHYRTGEIDNLQIKYGIEAFFAPREKALALEQDLRDGGVAVLMVSERGRAALKTVVAD